MNFLTKFYPIFYDLAGGLGDASAKVKSDGDAVFIPLILAGCGIFCIFMMIPPTRKWAKDNMVWALLAVFIYFGVASFISYAQTLGSLLG